MISKPVVAVQFLNRRINDETEQNGTEAKTDDKAVAPIYSGTTNGNDILSSA